jgi:Fic family protein
VNHRFGDRSRPYIKTHPWITFTFDLNRLTALDWVRLGEVLSKCDHIAYAALPSEISSDLHQIYLAKGIHASAQIEGNSLSEEQVRARVGGDLRLPESQEYLGREIDNIREACNLVCRELDEGDDLRLTTDRISQLNKLVLDGLPLDEDVVPGQIRTKGVVVGSVYQGPPAADCEYLLDQVCSWLDQMLDDAAALVPEWGRAVGVIRAILAHLYLEWIHPFGDGNGRTGRLIEFQLLLAAGFPTPACHLLSNYYNKTRTRYYQALRETSQAEDHPVWRFASYAIQGFAEEIRDQVSVIQQHQLGLAWVNLVGQADLGRTEVTSSRRRALLLALPAEGPEDFTPISALNRIDPDIAAMYAIKKTKTLTRDINTLEQAGLIVRSTGGEGIRPRFEQLFAFLPLRKVKGTASQEIMDSLAAASVPITESALSDRS